MNRRIILLCFMAFAVTACGSSGTSTSTSSPAAAASTPASSPAGLASTQATQICNDLLAWSKVAYNEDMPRFTQALVNDTNEAEAADSQLGSDMGSLETDLTQINSLALEPGPPGQPSDAQAVDYDCQQYGVNIQDWGPPVSSS
jgi:hypothetical protein